MFIRMATIRAFEEHIGVESMAGTIRGPVHQSIGQEAVAVGVCTNLEREDYLFSNHRGHGHAIAKGADLHGMMKELYGRVGGLCGGKGGSMHVADFSAGMLGANGILADGATMAVGAAQAIELRGESRIASVFIGDGSTNRGPFLESLNWAVVFQLPVLFVVEDNRWASSTWSSTVSAGPGIAARANAFGLECDSVDGNDIAAVDDVAAQAVNRVRAERKPRVLHARTFRTKGHITRDEQLYRLRAPQVHVEDPLTRAALLLEKLGCTRTEVAALSAEALSRVDEAARAAASAPVPDKSLAYQDVQDLGGPTWCN